MRSARGKISESFIIGYIRLVCTLYVSFKLIHNQSRRMGFSLLMGIDQRLYYKCACVCACACACVCVRACMRVHVHMCIHAYVNI